MFHFSYSPEDLLCAEDVSLVRIAQEVGTPTFVYAQATLQRHLSVFDQAFAGHPHLICYSVKANSNGSVLQLLQREGAGADIVSGGELARALRAGFSADSIVFSGVGKTPEEMRAALSAGILCFNVESESELRTLNEVAQQMGQVAPVSLRVNPDVDAKTHPYIATGLQESKFGVPIKEGERIAVQMQQMKGVRLVGVDCHIGSQLTSLAPLLEALDSVLALVDRLTAAGFQIEHIDLGGGLGIPYKKGDEAPPHPREFGAAVVERLKGRKERLILEPGRVIVGNAGVLLTKVLYVKRTEARTFVILDAAMNDLLRPSLYRAHHDIWPVQKRPGEPERVDLVGPICESGDTFAKDRMIESPQEGDYLAIMSAGAYGFTMASTYNSRPKAAEVLVSKDRFHVARKRESVEDLFAGEAFPPWTHD